MSRFGHIVLISLILGVLSTAAITSKVHATDCVPNWHVVQSKSIFVIDHLVYTPLGSVSLSRDGCGDIQAQVMNAGEPISSASLTITNASNNSTIYFSNSVQRRGIVAKIVSPIFSGYGGVPITVTGSVTDTTGLSASATTAPDAGN